MAQWNEINRAKFELNGWTVKASGNPPMWKIYRPNGKIIKGESWPWPSYTFALRHAEDLMA